MGYRKMAKDDEGNVYVAERSVDSDAVLKVVTFTKARHGDVVYWPSATYEVSAPGVAPVQIIRHGNGNYDVPDKAVRLNMLDAVRVALGRMEPPAGVRTSRLPVVTAAAARHGHDLPTTRNTRGATPAVIAEPEENWALRQGDRIMRHLALYPNGVDAQTMSAGMHGLAASVIRKHLRLLVKDNGPVVLVKTGVYARRAN